MLFSIRIVLIKLTFHVKITKKKFFIFFSLLLWLLWPLEMKWLKWKMGLPTKTDLRVRELRKNLLRSQKRQREKLFMKMRIWSGKKRIEDFANLMCFTSSLVGKFFWVVVRRKLQLKILMCTSFINDVVDISLRSKLILYSWKNHSGKLVLKHVLICLDKKFTQGVTKSKLSFIFFSSSTTFTQLSQQIKR